MKTSRFYIRTMLWLVAPSLVGGNVFAKETMLGKTLDLYETVCGKCR